MGIIPSLVTNPMYILHLTDFHLGDENIDKHFTKDFQNNLITKIITFLDSRGRNHLDVLCITGDMMDKNAGNKEYFDSATEFILNLKSAVKNITKIYCTPGNHDLNFEDAFNIEGLNLDRQKTIEDRSIPNYKLVDDYYSKLTACFEKYKTFVDAIDANILSKGKKDPENLRYFLGSDEMELPFNKKIFISWFNTSWLCLLEGQWKKILQSEGDHIESRTKYFYDHDKISAGKYINQGIFDSFNKLQTFKNFAEPEKTEYLFTLSMCHHFPRLLSWHDQYDHFNKTTSEAEEAFYTHLSKYSLVLNGHTHGQLFDSPFATNSNLDYTTRPAAIVIYEVNFLTNFIVHYRVPIDKEGSSKDFSIDKITTFNEEKFLSHWKSLYCYKDLVEDLMWHETCFGQPGHPALDPIERLNIAIEQEYMSQELTT